MPVFKRMIKYKNSICQCMYIYQILQHENWQVKAIEVKHCSSSNNSAEKLPPRYPLIHYFDACHPPNITPIILSIDPTLILHYISWTEKKNLGNGSVKMREHQVCHIPILWDLWEANLIHRDSDPQSAVPLGFITNMQVPDMSKHLSDVIHPCPFPQRKCRSHST